MSKKTTIRIRMDSDLKAQADALFNELGMNISTAFTPVSPGGKDPFRNFPESARWRNACCSDGSRSDCKGPDSQGLF